MNNTTTSDPREHGRLTRQRQAVFEALATSPGHPTAAQVYTAVRQRQPGIAYGTIYNALHYLVDAGLAAEVLRPDGVVGYDRDTTPHDHAICRVCGELTDVRVPRVRHDVAASYLTVAQQTGFMVEQHRVAFVGLCPTCQTATDHAGPRTSAGG